MKTGLRTVHGQPSWSVANKQVQVFVTETGGQVGPVTFRLGRRKIQPFAVAPWAEEQTSADLPPMLKVLRGDFFCMPFGANARPFRGERHPPHGETANRRWTLQDAGPQRLELVMDLRARKGRVTKTVWVRSGEPLVYQRHVITGLSGPMSFGHHAMLKFPERPGSGRISTSPFSLGHVSPQALENPETRGYSCLEPGATFRTLRKVPLQNGRFADLSRYPARRGFEDLVLLESAPHLPIGWTAVAFPEQGYVWFALKNPRILRQTILWVSNGGRHYPPWNGRHLGVLGLEEVTSYFHYGLAESAARNPLAAKGRPTCAHLKPQARLEVNYIMGIAPIPRRFDEVAGVTVDADAKSLKLSSRSGCHVQVPAELTELNVFNK